MNYNGHLLQPLRTERDRLLDELSESCNPKVLESACKGETHDFKEAHYNINDTLCMCDDEGCSCPSRWDSDTHQDFYNACLALDQCEKIIYDATPKFRFEPQCA